MLAQVKFLPNEPREKGGTRYIDILCVLENGEEHNLYGEEGSADWDAFQNLDKGEVIEVESFEKNGNTFYRLTEFQLDLTLSGQQHIANVGDTADPFEVLDVLLNLYQNSNERL